MKGEYPAGVDAIRPQDEAVELTVYLARQLHQPFSEIDGLTLKEAWRLVKATERAIARENAPTGGAT